MSNQEQKNNKIANVLVIGGTGTGKTFEYIKPNILKESEHILGANLVAETKKNKLFAGSNEVKYEIRPTSLDIEMANTIRKFQPELSEDEAVAIAYNFTNEAWVYDYLYHRRYEGASCIESFDLIQEYGAEPFIFDETGKRISINEPVFSEFIKDIWENKYMHHYLTLSLDEEEAMKKGELKIIYPE